MAGWDYKGLSIKNSIRVKARENCVVYPERVRSDSANGHGIWLKHHVVLGNGTVRLCSRKYDPYLYKDEKEVDLSGYYVPVDITEDAEFRYEGVLDGCTFYIEALASENHALHMRLTEPDDTTWEGVAFYSAGKTGQFPKEAWRYGTEEDDSI